MSGLFLVELSWGVQGHGCTEGVIFLPDVSLAGWVRVPGPVHSAHRPDVGSSDAVELAESPGVVVGAVSRDSGTSVGPLLLKAWLVLDATGNIAPRADRLREENWK